MHNSAESGSSARVDAGPSTREQILEAALECFSEYGFDGAKSRAIAERAGVNVGLIKYYFDGKDPLWREAVDRAFGQLHETIDAALEDLVDLAPRDRLRVVLRRLTRFVAEKPHFTRLMNDEGKRDSERMRWIVDRHERPMYLRFVELIESWGSDAPLATSTTPAHIFYLFTGALSLLFHQAPECRYLTGVDPTDPDVIDAQVDLVIALAFPEAASEQRSSS